MVTSIRNILTDNFIFALFFSQMMNIPEFRTMYSAAENHYQELRLSHLTGKDSDLM